MINIKSIEISKPFDNIVMSENSKQNLFLNLEEFYSIKKITLQKKSELEICIFTNSKDINDSNFKNYKKKIEIELQAKSQLNFFLLIQNLSILNLEINIKQAEENSQSHFFALIKGSSDSKINLKIKNFHSSSNTKSNQLIKSLATENSFLEILSSSFIDKNIKEVATNQQLKNLFLSSKAKIIAKPELEINAKKVTARHGFSSTKIRPEDYFFLQARGFKQAQAEKLLIQNFIADIFEKLDPICKLKEFRNLFF
jgi:Fe-S cluster assembly protein SufD